MKPIKFKEQNITFAENQPEYLPLPAFKDPGDQGAVVTCWRLSLYERLIILFTGKLWASSMTYHQPLQPLYFSVIKADIIAEKEESNE